MGSHSVDGRLAASVRTLNYRRLEGGGFISNRLEVDFLSPLPRGWESSVSKAVAGGLRGPSRAAEGLLPPHPCLAAGRLAFSRPSGEKEPFHLRFASKRGVSIIPEKDAKEETNWPKVSRL
jgi:hypothetical protein